MAHQSIFLFRLPGVGRLLQRIEHKLGVHEALCASNDDRNSLITLQREIVACILLTFFGRKERRASLCGTKNTAREDAIMSGWNPSHKPNGRLSDEVNSEKGKAQ